ncbi:LysR substrate-binding domain-containing protein [Naumannella halotolerans]|uniref:LysR substrate-binding domain-containing protein n=1 Tax=Naumannella halotolerans TaxID=993414 RepID=UPI00370D8569
MTDQPDPPAAPLRIGFVPGVTLTKWRRIWSERFGRRPLEVVEVDAAAQREVLDSGQFDMCFVRLPIERDDLHLIPLYDELPVLWLSKEHLLSALDEITADDLAEEDVRTDPNPMNIDLTAAQHTVLHVPMSIARTHSRRDLTYRPIVDANPTTIGLAWRTDNNHPMIDEFIGIVRGRTANSSRTAQERQPEKPSKKSGKRATDRDRQQRRRPRHRR